MSGWIYNIGLNVVGQSQIGGAVSSLTNLTNQVNRTNNSLNNTNNKLNQVGKTGKESFDGIKSSLTGLIAKLGGAYALLDSLKTTARLENLEKSLAFAGGEAGAKNVLLVKSAVEEYGLALEETMHGAKTLSGSLMGTGMEDQFPKILQGMSMASAAMGLTGERTGLAFLALGQMASKGFVQMEELKGQLAEQLPGAMGLFARALGVSQLKLTQMIKDGLAAKDVLGKVADEMIRTYGPAMGEMMNSSQANFNRFSNAILELKVALGTELMPMVISVLKDGLIPAMKGIADNIHVLKDLATGFLLIYVNAKLAWFWTAMFGGVKAIMVAASEGMTIYKIAVQGVTLFSSLLRFELMRLTTLLMANPIGALIAGLVIVSTLIKVLMDKFEGFRMVMFGLAEASKHFFGKLFGIDDGLTMGESWAKGLKEGSESWLKDHPLDIKSYLAKGSEIGSSLGINYDPISKIFNKHTGKSKAEADKNKLSSKAKAGIEGITSGGVRNITINIGKQIENLSIKAETFEKGTDEMMDVIISKLTQAINSANQVQTSN